MNLLCLGVLVAQSFLTSATLTPSASSPAPVEQAVHHDEYAVIWINPRNGRSELGTGRTIAKVVGATVAVVAVSATAIGAFAVVDVVREIKPAVQIESEKILEGVPDIGAMEGGLNFLLGEMSNLRVAGVAPLGESVDRRFFDAEVQVQFNQRF